ncbi:MAG: ATP synthase F1 subunit delta [Erysipelotrichaceae bacterium]|nr:ATP synthase F1 subunit delta [Erysipelotrichaceae bacterium]
MSLIASRYAEAFFSLGLDKKCVKEFKDELNTVKDIFAEVENIKEFFISERVSKADKKKIISDALANKTSKDTINFLLLLVDKGRISYYEEIIDSYIHLANDELQIKEGIIESVRPLDTDKVKELEKALSKDGQKVELKQKINKALISGFKIKFDNQIIDASMKEKIDKMQELISRKGGQSWN